MMALAADAPAVLTTVEEVEVADINPSIGTTHGGHWV